MHRAAVFVLCALVTWSVWQDLALAFLDWYSGLEPPLTTKTKVLIAARALTRPGVRGLFYPGEVPSAATPPTDSASRASS